MIDMPSIPQIVLIFLVITGIISLILYGLYLLFGTTFIFVVISSLLTALVVSAYYV